MRRATEEERAALGALLAAPSDAGPLVSVPSADGGQEGGVLLCASLAALPRAAPLSLVCEEGFWSDAGGEPWGAAGRAGVAALALVARRLAAEPPPVPVELLFAADPDSFDARALRSRVGFALTHPGPLGDVVLAAPHEHRIVAELAGVAAHAGIRPHEGRSAIVAAARAIGVMPFGRIDAETSANVGLIAGGVDATVVPGSCRVVAEARGHDEVKVEALVAELVDHLHDGANAAECDLDVTTERCARGYRVKPSAPEVALAEAALRAVGYAPRQVTAGAGCETNALRAAGFPCLALGNGSVRAHEPGERIADAALIDTFHLALALIDAAADGGVSV